MRFARIPLAPALALAAVVVASPVAAQTVPGWDSGVLVSYNLADLETAAPLAGFSAEVDFRFSGITPCQLRRPRVEDGPERVHRCRAPCDARPGAP